MLDYEKIKRKKKWENFQNKIISTSIMERYCIQTGFDYNKVKQKINADEMFRWFFIKEPIRQNIHEKTAMEFIQKIKVG